MECSFTMDCFRHKLLGNLIFKLEVFEKSLILTNLSDSKQKQKELNINYELSVDFKIRNKQLVAIGLTTKKHHWYYSDHENLEVLKQLLGGKVIFKGINELYNPMQQIGQGTFSNVYLLQSKLAPTKHYACKCFDKTQVEEGVGKAGLLEEIKAMVVLRHINVAELIEFYEGEVSYYMVLEYYDLEFTDILKELQIEDVHIILKQLATCLSFMHQNGYMHRDLKPENIMFSETIHNLKLIDFGLTTKEPGKVKCGTAGYVAPEILNLEPCLNQYDEKCDIFSLGVIFYKMLTSHDLFPGAEHDEILRNNARCTINLELLHGNPSINHAALNLLQEMLAVDPTQRIDAKSILRHEYFVLEEKKHTNSLNNLGSVVRKHSSVIKQLSPLQKINHTSPFTIYDEEIIENEAQMQPIPTVIMKGGSQTDIQQVDRANQKRAKEILKKYVTADFDEIVTEIQQHHYRPPKPSQLQEMYYL